MSIVSYEEKMRQSQRDFAAEMAEMDDFDSLPTIEVITMETVQGIVEKINCNANGFYGVKLGETWYGAGKYAPKFDEGDEVSFGYTMNGKYANMDFKSVDVIAKATAAPSPAPSSQASSSAALPSGAAPKSGGTNWDLKDKRITYLASRKDALALIDVLIAADALVLPGGTKKAERYQAVCAMVNDTTQEMYSEIYGENFAGGE